MIGNILSESIHPHWEREIKIYWNYFSSFCPEIKIFDLFIIDLFLSSDDPLEYVKFRNYVCGKYVLISEYFVSLFSFVWSQLSLRFDA